MFLKYAFLMRLSIGWFIFGVLLFLSTGSEVATMSIDSGAGADASRTQDSPFTFSEFPSANDSYSELVAWSTALEEASEISQSTEKVEVEALHLEIFSTPCNFREYVIKGSDGNEIKLFVRTPPQHDVQKPVPGVLRIHGGGMTFTTANDVISSFFSEGMCKQGLVVVAVEFRNAGGRLGPHPYPAGLNDCSSALQWMSEHKEELGINKIILQGESGGSNLALAMTIRAKREGWLGKIDGVYALCPYINNYRSVEDNTMTKAAAVIERLYHPADPKTKNPLVWPFHVSESELQGMPPHVIVVNENDPYVAEGLEYYRRLHRAGVRGHGRVSVDTNHAAEFVNIAKMPELFLSTMADIRRFSHLV